MVSYEIIFKGSRDGIVTYRWREMVGGKKLQLEQRSLNVQP